MNFLASLPKPPFGDPCNGCGYCCASQPCKLAQEFLNCTIGPCVALESQGGKNICGLVRNPLGYIFKAAHPNTEVWLLDPAPDIEGGRRLSSDIASALGVGKGCDSDDDRESAAWPRRMQN